MDDLVQRRLRFIERQKTLHADAVNVQFEGLTPSGTGDANRDGMPKLPVGQHEVRELAGARPRRRTRRSRSTHWRLEVGGLVENPVTLTWTDFLALPQVDDVSDFHCVTTWSRFDNHWRGVRFRTLAELVVPKDDGDARALHRLRPRCRAPRSPTRRTCRWRARWKTTCCSCTPGRASRCRASTAARSA